MGEPVPARKKEITQAVQGMAVAVSGRKGKDTPAHEAAQQDVSPGTQGLPAVA